MIRRLRGPGVAVLACATVGWSAPSGAQPADVRFELGPEVQVYAGSTPGPQAITLADMNRDGRDDLLVASSELQEVTALLAADDGSGELFEEEFYSVSGTPVAVVAADFNPDSVRDFAVATVDPDGVSIVTSDPGDPFDLELDESAQFLLDAAPLGIVAARFDSDTRVDLAVLTANGVCVFRNTVVDFEVSFQPFRPSAPCFAAGGNDATGIAGGDFDGDGDTDLAVLDSAGEAVFLHRNDASSGLFLPPQATSLRGTGTDLQANAIIGALFDGDATADVVVVGDEFLGGDSVRTLLGAPDGLRAPIESLSLFASANAVAAADFNRDGSLDLVVAQDQDEALAGAVVLNEGSGTFTIGESFVSDFPGAAVATGDVNGDLLPDFVVLTSDGELVDVALNSTDERLPTPTSVPTPTSRPRSEDDDNGCAVVPAGGAGAAMLLPALLVLALARRRRD